MICIRSDKAISQAAKHLKPHLIKKAISKIEFQKTIARWKKEELKILITDDAISSASDVSKYVSANKSFFRHWRSPTECFRYLDWTFLTF